MLPYGFYLEEKPAKILWECLVGIDPWTQGISTLSLLMAGNNQSTKQVNHLDF